MKTHNAAWHKKRERANRKSAHYAIERGRKHNRRGGGRRRRGPTPSTFWMSVADKFDKFTRMAAWMNRNRSEQGE